MSEELTGMKSSAEAIYAQLAAVGEERARRIRDTRLAERVTRVKAFQQARFANTYADLLDHRRYGAAARFFLDEVYGPNDFSARDAEFAKVVPAAVRMLSEDAIRVVLSVAELHAITERLDNEMADGLPTTLVTRKSYAKAWCAVGQRVQRARQIELTLFIGTQLDKLARKALLRHTLRMMRGPAKAAGLGGLQGFLERGFEAFYAMDGAGSFLEIIEKRERAYSDELFGAHDKDAER